ncbi:unnamed protein product [Cylindrotheca closterium]|uniref:Uncharacterized protein n=1 Tax=Cylindrotheca closterium TaxID=2856 RepID=A0AAD2FF13_9STRA|nr:unnamed protein product [Cylindrotheca closterium]
MSLHFTKPTTRPEWAASIAVCLFGTMGAIQVGIAVGLLPSDIVWGGANDELTFQASIASLAACAILCGMAHIVHRRTKPGPSKFIRGASWFVAFYMGLNTLGNALAKTWLEQYIFGTMTFVLCICSFVVASSKPLDDDDPSTEDVSADATPYGTME